MKVRKLAPIALMAASALAFTACGGSASSTADGEVYKIGVLQLVQHAALDKANEGFIAALDEAGINYEVDQQNASGEQSTCQTIADKFVNDDVDMIYAIATPAAQAAASATEEIPIILAAVTDPEGAGLVESNDNPGGNVTGASDLTPVKEQIELLTTLVPDAENVAIFYSSSEANSEIQAQMARVALDEANIAWENYTVSSSNEIQTVVESMIGKVDAIYIPTDNTLAAGMATVSQVANDNGIPTICGEANMVEEGGLATYGIDYYQHGLIAGRQAIAVLTGEAEPATLPIAYGDASNMELTVNEETAEILGIDLSVLED